MAQTRKGRVDVAVATRIASQALQHGPFVAQISGYLSTTVDYSGSCQNPRTFTIEGRAWKPFSHMPAVKFDEILGEPVFFHGRLHSPRRMNPYWVDMSVRCRRCPACLRARARIWRRRAISELAASPRSWFGTLTLTPQAHHHFISLARVRSSRGGVDFDTLSQEERGRREHREIGDEITRYLKRVRKNSGAGLRYLLVMEWHKSLLPHYHLLVHETDSDSVLRYRHLTECWTLGYSMWKVVDEGPAAAGYVTKYLTKSAMARVRASKRYGENAI